MQIYRAISKIMDTITGGALKVSQWLLFVMGCMIIYDVGMRYLFNQPTAWAAEISEYILVGIAFFGVAAVQSENRHIKMDFFYQKFSSHVRLYFDFFFNICMQIFNVILLWFSVKMTYSAFIYDSFSNSLLETPLFIPYLIVPLGIFLLFLQSMVNLVGIFLELQKT